MLQQGKSKMCWIWTISAFLPLHRAETVILSSFVLDSSVIFMLHVYDCLMWEHCPLLLPFFAHYQRLWGTEHVGHGHLNTRHSSLWLLCFWLISHLGVSRKCSGYAAYDLTSKTKVMKRSKVCAVWRIPPCIKWISVTFITWLQFRNKYV